MSIHRLWVTALVLLSLGMAARPTSMTGSQIPFTEVTQSAELSFRHHKNTLMETGGGGALLDYNDDRYQDLYVTATGGPNVLFRNNGNDTFTDVTSFAGVAAEAAITRGVACADYDMD